MGGSGEPPVSLPEPVADAKRQEISARARLGSPDGAAVLSSQWADTGRDRVSVVNLSEPYVTE